MRHLGMIPWLPAGLFARTPRATERLAPKPRGRAIRMLASNGTFNDGRNEEKRKACADARKERAIQVAVHQQSEIGVRRAPKCRLSVLEMNMLANRRLRQTRGGL